MREIKFRWWRGASWNVPNHMAYFTLSQIMDTDPPSDPFSGGDVLMQYTGLKDISGKEIYEGDIVKVGGWKDVIESVFDLIKMNDVEEIYGDIEVIGNIYETPNLIKK